MGEAGLTADGFSSVLPRYTMCIMAGCQSDYEAPPELLHSMGAGALTVQAVDAKAKPLSVTVSLADFQAAHNGPFSGPLVDEIEQSRRESRKPSRSQPKSPPKVAAHVLARRHLESACSATRALSE